MRFGGNISRTAEFVGMERSALHRKLKGLGITDEARGSARRSRGARHDKSGDKTNPVAGVGPLGDAAQ